MNDSFYSFYKRTTLPSVFNKTNQITKNTRTHHQSTDRITQMGSRKSGKMNLVGASHNQQLKNSVVNNFANSKNLVLQGLTWPIVKPILDEYNKKHDFDSEEPYTKALNKIQCKLTGRKIFIKYNPENKTWTLFKH